MRVLIWYQAARVMLLLIRVVRLRCTILCLDRSASLGDADDVSDDAPRAAGSEDAAVVDDDAHLCGVEGADTARADVVADSNYCSIVDGYQQRS